MIDVDKSDCVFRLAAHVDVQASSMTVPDELLSRPINKIRTSKLAWYERRDDCTIVKA